MAGAQHVPRRLQPDAGAAAGEQHMTWLAVFHRWGGQQQLPLALEPVALPVALAKGIALPQPSNRP